jgi:hypothetical protein
MSEEIVENQTKIGEKLKPVRNFYALIDYGRFSGKHPFVYKIFTKSDKARDYIIDTSYKRSDIIKLTEEEYNYIKNIDSCIEVLYNENVKGLKRFFY